MNSRERKLHDAGSGYVISMAGDRVVAKDVDRTAQFEESFSQVFWSVDGKPEGAQQAVYDGIGAPMVDLALNATNTAMIAYGQTGTGKSFSMMGGCGDTQGLLPRAISDLFAKRPPGMRVEISYVEIYNERLRDCLKLDVDGGDGRNDSPLKLRYDRERGTATVSGLSWIEAADAMAAVELINTAEAARVVAATQMNAVSNRAHGICQVRLSDANGSALNTMIFADLAGSERASATKATGNRLKEGANINKSLSALGSVVSALSNAEASPTRKTLVPYRESVVTQLLQGALSSTGCHTTLLVTVSPMRSEFDETLASLKFGQRVLKIGRTPSDDAAPQQKSSDVEASMVESSSTVSPDASLAAVAQARQATRLTERESAMNGRWLAMRQALDMVSGLSPAKAAQRYADLRSKGLSKSLKIRWRLTCDRELAELSKLTGGGPDEGHTDKSSEPFKIPR